MAIYLPAAEPVYDANSLLLDFETQFLMSIRNSAIESWAQQFAFKPSRLYRNLSVRVPLDLTSYGFSAWKGHHEFREASSKHFDLTITQWQEGAKCDTRLLRDPMSNEIMMWDQRRGNIMSALDRLIPSEVYTLINGGETATTWTGGSAFFATDHNVNPHRTDFGTFANLFNNGLANAATPWYFVLGGGPFDSMFPWGIFRGEGMGPSIQSAGGGSSGIMSENGYTVITWDTSSEQFKTSFEVKVSVMAELGFGLMFPHCILRNEGDITYANLKAMLDAAVAMKDLNGYNPAQQIMIKAILVSSASQVSTVREQLGYDVANVGATAPTGASSNVDSRLRGVPIIPMSR